MVNPPYPQLGVTATQCGLTEAQFNAARDLVDTLYPLGLHHGDCIGGDAQFHNIAHTRWVLWGAPQVVIHPPSNPKKRAFCEGNCVLRINEPKPYLERNHNIVLDTSALLACPHDIIHTECRHGTCATVRYARKLGRPIAIIHTDGKVEYERWTH